MKKQTPRGFLSPYELKSSLRDTLIVGGGALVLELIKVLQGADFGEYTVLAVAFLTFLATIINRWLNIWRR